MSTRSFYWRGSSLVWEELLRRFILDLLPASVDVGYQILGGGWGLRLVSPSLGSCIPVRQWLSLRQIRCLPSLLIFKCHSFDDGIDTCLVFNFAPDLFPFSSTMVTAILPAIVAVTDDNKSSATTSPPSSSSTRPSALEPLETEPSMSPSLSSELTVTPARLAQSPLIRKETEERPLRSRSGSPSILAGYVGFATGCGALLALTVFLPLPARFSSLAGVSPAQAVVYSYYVVGFIALVVAGACFVGLRNLAGERIQERKYQSGTDHERSGNEQVEGPSSAYEATQISWRALLNAATIGLRDSRIGLGYVGGFVARFVRSFI